MQSATQLVAALLMGLFALGVIGCAITIPICAFKFFAILFERDEQQPEVTGYRMVPVYASAEPATASSSEAAKAPPVPPKRRGAAAGK